MDKKSIIVVMTHNPQGDYGDVRPQIEKENGYKNWKKSIKVEEGQLVLIYISGNSQRIEYLMRVDNVYEDSMDLRLIEKLSIEKSNQLKLKKLQENGFKNGTVNYILNNNIQLYKYIISVLNITTKKEVKKDMNIKNIILYGAPGVGKTHNYKNMISQIEQGKSQKEIFNSIQTNELFDNEDESFQNVKNEKRVEFITFHQSFSYEDFIEGFRPQENGNLEIEDGIFKLISKNAKNQVFQKETKTISFDDAYDMLREKYFENTLSKIYSVSDVEILIHEFKENTLKVQSANAKDTQYVKKSDLETVVNSFMKDEITKPSDIKKLDVKKDTISLAGLYFPFGKLISQIMKENKSQKKKKKTFI